jgi:hypothetical protein
MRYAIRVTLMIGVAAGGLMTMSEYQLSAQGADPNAAPNPYKPAFAG